MARTCREADSPSIDPENSTASRRTVAAVFGVLNVGYYQYSRVRLIYLPSLPSQTRHLHLTMAPHRLAEPPGTALVVGRVRSFSEGD